MQDSQNIVKVVDILETKINIGTLSEYAQTILEWAESRKSAYVSVANTHMLVVAKQDPAFRNVLNCANLIVPDGGPLVSKIKRNGYKFQERAAGYDLTVELMSRCEKLGLPIGFFGSSKDDLEKCKMEVGELFPDLQLNLLLSPPVFEQLQEVEGFLDQIKKAECKILFVCLGCPKQEFWMNRFSPELSMPLVGIGGALDLLTKKYERAPKFMRENSLEWLYRLYKEPRRLWRRYLVNNSLYIWFLIYQYLKDQKNKYFA